VQNRQRFFLPALDRFFAIASHLVSNSLPGRTDSLKAKPIKGNCEAIRFPSNDQRRHYR
jgi:hypothetical protein